jgi:succinate dehydrogenase / fumarate reductase cytochrome b subunit
MFWTGNLIALYILFHLADLTWGWTTSEFVRGDVYHNLDVSLSRWPVALIYIAAAVLLAVHLYHGVSSALQSVGLSNPKMQAIRTPAAIAVAAFVLVLNLSFPIAILAGIVAE